MTSPSGAFTMTADGSGAGAAVPIATSAHCPECDRTVALNSDGTYRRHPTKTYQRVCPMSGF